MVFFTIRWNLPCYVIPKEQMLGNLQDSTTGSILKFSVNCFSTLIDSLFSYEDVGEKEHLSLPIICNYFLSIFQESSQVIWYIFESGIFPDYLGIIKLSGQVELLINGLVEELT